MCYIIGDVTIPKPIWIGPSDVSDQKYSFGAHVPLSLVNPRELGLENPFPDGVSYVH